MNNSSIITTLHKDWGKMKLGKLGQKNVDYFVSILGIFQHAEMQKGELPQELTIPFQGIKELALVEKNGKLVADTIHTKEFIGKLQNLGRDLIVIYSEFYENGIFSLQTLFEKYEINENTETITIRWSEKSIPLVKHLTSNALYIKRDFYLLKSNYSKVLYIMLKEFDNKTNRVYKASGHCEFMITLDDFKTRLDISEKYTNTNIWKRIINPAIEELKPYFVDLHCESVISKRKTVGYKFSWIPEVNILTEKQKNAIEMKKEGVTPKKKTNALMSEKDMLEHMGGATSWDELESKLLKNE